MKNAITIFLLLIFTYNLGGSFLFFKIEQLQIRKEIAKNINNGIPQEGLTRINLSSENQYKVAWKNDEEFKYEGVLYDVVYAETPSHNRVTYYCVTDMQETNLIAKFNSENEKSHKNNIPKNVFELVKIVIPANFFEKNMELALSQSSKPSYNYCNTYQSFSSEVISPPPKMH